MADNTLTLTFAQISNMSALPTNSPSVVHTGLPFGDSRPLDPPSAIHGVALGLPTYLNPKLIFMAYDDLAEAWATGKSWVAEVKDTGAYDAQVARQADRFAAVVMTAQFWLAFSSGKGDSFTVRELPTPESNPADVIYSTIFTPGLGRTVLILAEFNYLVKSLPPGSVYPMPSSDPMMNERPQMLHIHRKDQATQYELRFPDKQTKKVWPTDPAFLEAYLRTAPRMQGVPPPKPGPTLMPRPSLESMSTLVIAPKPIDPGKPNGYIVFAIYQAHDGSLMMMVGYEGPHAPFEGQVNVLYDGNPLKTNKMDVTVIFNVFADRVLFDVVGATQDIKPTVLGIIVSTFFKVAKKAASIAFSA